MHLVEEVTHPLIQHKLTLMRQKDTSTAKFRNLMREISLLLGYEVTRNMPLRTENIETPICSYEAPFLDQRQAALISVLRAGNGLVDGLLELMPNAKVGHIGLYRDTTANTVIEYYYKLPQDIQERVAIVGDPMLATGMTASAAISRLKEAKPQNIIFVCLLASPKGLEVFHEHHPDVKVYTASIDEGLTENGYIIPGLGDAGDRLYGTL